MVIRKADGSTSSSLLPRGARRRPLRRVPSCITSSCAVSTVWPSAQCSAGFTLVVSCRSSPAPSARLLKGHRIRGTSAQSVCRETPQGAPGSSAVNPHAFRKGPSVMPRVVVRLYGAKTNQILVCPILACWFPARMLPRRVLCGGGGRITSWRRRLPGICIRSLVREFVGA